MQKYGMNTPEYMNFIFLDLGNHLDFLRRRKESRCDKCQPGAWRGLTELNTDGKVGQVSVLQEQSLRAGEHIDRSAALLERYAKRWVGLVAGRAMPLGATLALVWLATVGVVVINYFVPFNLVSLIYMLPVVVAATQWGLGLGIVAAIAGAAAADFFFYPPLYTFWIRDPQNVVDLILFLLIAVVTSNLAARLKNEAVAVQRREKEIIELHAFSQGLATCLTSRDLIFAVQDYLSNTLRYRAVLIATDNTMHGRAGVPEDVRRRAGELIARGNAPAASTVTDSRSGRAWLVRLIDPEILGYGAIAVDLGDARGENADFIVRRVGKLLEEATLTLKYLKAKEAIEQATLNYQTEILRDALVGGISHELRTPLATIIGSCSVLNRIPAVQSDRQSRELVEAINEQAGQLDNEIRNLLDATRITAKGVRPQLMWSDPTDIVNAALKQKARKLAAHRVSLDVAREVPLVHVDTVLVEQALGQLLENAAKYSPPGTEIKVCSRSADNSVVISVMDQGSGLTADEKGQIGRRPFRGDGIGTGGSGLGLWIASTFVAANGGTLHAESRGPGLGTTMSMRLSTVSAETPELLEVVDG
jgi:two-component system, OmpR family, sensor histidine kinase KdpD